jgi:hypothetical protein
MCSFVGVCFVRAGLVLGCVVWGPLFGCVVGFVLLWVLGVWGCARVVLGLGARPRVGFGLGSGFVLCMRVGIGRCRCVRLCVWGVSVFVCALCGCVCWFGVVSLLGLLCGCIGVFGVCVCALRAF